MSDIVKRLRGRPYVGTDTAEEAANEIERLRAERDALRKLLQFVASVAHDGGLRGLSEADALIKVRKLTVPYQNIAGSENQRTARLDAAIDAAREKG